MNEVIDGRVASRPAGEASGRRARAAVRRLRARAAAAAAAAVIFASLYFFVRLHFKDGVWSFDLYLFNKALAVSGLLLVTLSMALTGICYFKLAPRAWLADRKHLGLAGFWLALAHGVMSHALLPDHFAFPRWLGEKPAAAAVGTAALLVFGIMAAVSNDRGRSRLGGTVWRMFLRHAGYVALAAAAVHAGLLKWESWTNYLRNFDSVLPSFSLPAVLFAAVAFGLRIALWLSERRKRRGRV